MSSTTGSPQKSLTNETKVVEELKRSVDREMRGKGREVIDKTSNQLQALYLRYLSNLSPFRPHLTTRNRSESISSRNGTVSARSPAFLLSEPKQLDVNSGERQLVTFIGQNGDTVSHTKCITNEEDFLINHYQTRPICKDGSTSPLVFPQSKSVQTEDKLFAKLDNYADVLNNLIDELKSLLKIANQTNYKTNIQVMVDSVEKQTQTSTKLMPTKDAFTQCETNSQLVDAFCQINAIVKDKSTQTIHSNEEEVQRGTKEKAIDRLTQTDPLTDEDKSYDLSVGEIPYNSDDSTFC